MSLPLPPGDPAYWMLERGREDPSWRSRKVVHRDGCYICEDEEFELMGLPLCRPCPECQFIGSDKVVVPGHIPADDEICDDCGATDNPGRMEDDTRDEQTNPSSP